LSVANSKTILLLATYGMEIVECGGALAKNVQEGGRSVAAVLLCRPESRSQVDEAAKVLGVETRYLDFESGTINFDPESKKRLIRVIREVKPEIVIMQDPEHSYHDLDPDRRPAMLLYLESVALASRDFALEERSGLAPHHVCTIYYMTPEVANCVVDVTDVWDLKEEAMSKLKNQMAFSAEVLENLFGQSGLARLVGSLDRFKSKEELGRALHRETDRAFHLYHGICSHGHFVMSEPYRRQGNFHLQTLIC
jgi:hypothetical protein